MNIEAIAACWATASKPARPTIPRPVSLWIARRMVGHLADVAASDIDARNYDQPLCDLLHILHYNGYESLEHGPLDALARECREGDSDAR